MVSLAVSLVAADVRRLILSDQSLVTSAATVQSVQRWNSAGFAWVTVTTNDALPAGTVLWLRMSTNTTLSLTGTYAEPANQTLQPGATFIAGWGLQPLPLSSSFSSLSSTSLWAYNNQTKAWRKRLTGELQTLSDVPAMLAPGDAVFARPEVVSTLTVPESALAVRYYHQDHLGSSSVLTDAAGALVSETANYAFGFARNEFLPRNLREPYGFTQKERDTETFLHCFEARAVATSLSRFCSVDPISAMTLDARSMTNATKTLGLMSQVVLMSGVDNTTTNTLPTSNIRLPQKLNTHAFCRNNPLRYTDPTGLDEVDNVAAKAFGGRALAAVGAAITAAGVVTLDPPLAIVGAVIMKVGMNLEASAQKDVANQISQAVQDTLHE